MTKTRLTFLGTLAFAAAQQVGNYQNETHPKLQWSKCAADGGCQQISGELVMDANLRWLHKVDDWHSCFADGQWDYTVCNSVENCTANCAIEGAEYSYVYGVKSGNDSVSQQFVNKFDFSQNIGSRLFVSASKDKYQMFTLLNNELAFDVDLSTVECGINGALHFVAMDEDGGMSRHPGNKAGAEYGTGYCDSSCPRSLKFVAGKANTDMWFPSETDPVAGAGLLGACCPEFAVWNSNAHSFSMSSHICPRDDYQVCVGKDCDAWWIQPGERYNARCDFWGCGYNPYRLGATDFYGKGKKVDTSRKFTVVTQFGDTKVTQFFIQNGTRIDMPDPTLEGLPEHNGLTPEFCAKSSALFDEPDRFGLNGGWQTHLKMLSRPMVLSLSISDDHSYHNLWLDSTYPIDETDHPVPGTVRGDCPMDDNDPRVVESMNPKAKVVWSNIRFGPIGSTVKV
ncbi:Exoglucanase 1 [Rhypophila sp. PSN 637]